MNLICNLDPKTEPYLVIIANLIVEVKENARQENLNLSCSTAFSMVILKNQIGLDMSVSLEK